MLAVLLAVPPLPGADGKADKHKGNLDTAEGLLEQVGTDMSAFTGVSLQGGEAQKNQQNPINRISGAVQIINTADHDIPRDTAQTNREIKQLQDQKTGIEAQTDLDPITKAEKEKALDSQIENDQQQLKDLQREADRIPSLLDKASQLKSNAEAISQTPPPAPLPPPTPTSEPEKPKSPDANAGDNPASPPPPPTPAPNPTPNPEPKVTDAKQPVLSNSSVDKQVQVSQQQTGGEPIKPGATPPAPSPAGDASAGGAKAPGTGNGLAKVQDLKNMTASDLVDAAKSSLTEPAKRLAETYPQLTNAAKSGADWLYDRYEDVVNPRTPLPDGVKPGQLGQQLESQLDPSQPGSQKDLEKVVKQIKALDNQRLTSEDAAALKELKEKYKDQLSLADSLVKTPIDKSSDYYRDNIYGDGQVLSGGKAAINKQLKEDALARDPHAMADDLGQLKAGLKGKSSDEMRTQLGKFFDSNPALRSTDLYKVSQDWMNGKINEKDFANQFDAAASQWSGALTGPKAAETLTTSAFTQRNDKIEGFLRDQLDNENVSDSSKQAIRDALTKNTDAGLDGQQQRYRNLDNALKTLPEENLKTLRDARMQELDSNIAALGKQSLDARAQEVTAQEANLQSLQQTQAESKQLVETYAQKQQAQKEVSRLRELMLEPEPSSSQQTELARLRQAHPEAASTLEAAYKRFGELNANEADARSHLSGLHAPTGDEPTDQYKKAWHEWHDAQKAAQDERSQLEQKVDNLARSYGPTEEEARKYNALTTSAPSEMTPKEKADNAARISTEETAIKSRYAPDVQRLSAEGVELQNRHQELMQARDAASNRISGYGVQETMGDQFETDRIDKEIADNDKQHMEKVQARQKLLEAQAQDIQKLHDPFTAQSREEKSAAPNRLQQLGTEIQESQTRLNMAKTSYDELASARKASGFPALETQHERGAALELAADPTIPADDRARAAREAVDYYKGTRLPEGKKSSFYASQLQQSLDENSRWDQTVGQAAQQAISGGSKSSELKAVASSAGKFAAADKKWSEWQQNSDNVETAADYARNVTAPREQLKQQLLTQFKTHDLPINARLDGEAFGMPGQYVMQTTKEFGPTSANGMPSPQAKEVVGVYDASNKELFKETSTDGWMRTQTRDGSGYRLQEFRPDQTGTSQLVLDRSTHGTEVAQTYFPDPGDKSHYIFTKGDFTRTVQGDSVVQETRSGDSVTRENGSFVAGQFAPAEREQIIQTKQGAAAIYSKNMGDGLWASPAQIPVSTWKAGNIDNVDWSKLSGSPLERVQPDVGFIGASEKNLNAFVDRYSDRFSTVDQSVDKGLLATRLKAGLSTVTDTHGTYDVSRLNFDVSGGPRADVITTESGQYFRPRPGTTDTSFSMTERAVYRDFTQETHPVQADELFAEHELSAEGKALKASHGYEILREVPHGEAVTLGYQRPGELGMLRLGESAYVQKGVEHKALAQSETWGEKIWTGVMSMMPDYGLQQGLHRAAITPGGERIQLPDEVQYETSLVQEGKKEVGAWTGGAAYMLAEKMGLGDQAALKLTAFGQGIGEGAYEFAAQSAPSLVFTGVVMNGLKGAASLMMADEALTLGGSAVRTTGMALNAAVTGVEGRFGIGMIGDVGRASSELASALWNGNAATAESYARIVNATSEATNLLAMTKGAHEIFHGSGEEAGGKGGSDSGAAEERSDSRKASETQPAAERRAAAPPASEPPALRPEPLRAAAEVAPAAPRIEAGFESAPRVAARSAEAGASMPSGEPSAPIVEAPPSGGNIPSAASPEVDPNMARAPPTPIEPSASPRSSPSPEPAVSPSAADPSAGSAPLNQAEGNNLLGRGNLVDPHGKGGREFASLGGDNSGAAITRQVAQLPPEIRQEAPNPGGIVSPEATAVAHDAPPPAAGAPRGVDPTNIPPEVARQVMDGSSGNRAPIPTESPRIAPAAEQVSGRAETPSERFAQPDLREQTRHIPEPSNEPRRGAEPSVDRQERPPAHPSGTEEGAELRQHAPDHAAARESTENGAPNRGADQAAPRASESGREGARSGVAHDEAPLPRANQAEGEPLRPSEPNQPLGTGKGESKPSGPPEKPGPLTRAAQRVEYRMAKNLTSLGEAMTDVGHGIDSIESAVTGPIRRMLGLGEKPTTAEFQRLKSLEAAEYDLNAKSDTVSRERDALEKKLKQAEEHDLSKEGKKWSKTEAEKAARIRDEARKVSNEAEKLERTAKQLKEKSKGQSRLRARESREAAQRRLEQASRLRESARQLSAEAAGGEAKAGIIRDLTNAPAQRLRAQIKALDKVQAQLDAAKKSLDGKYSARDKGIKEFLKQNPKFKPAPSMLANTFFGPGQQLAETRSPLLGRPSNQVGAGPSAPQQRKDEADREEVLSRMEASAKRADQQLDAVNMETHKALRFGAADGATLVDAATGKAFKGELSETELKHVADKAAVDADREARREAKESGIEYNKRLQRGLKEGTIVPVDGVTADITKVRDPGLDRDVSAKTCYFDTTANQLKHAGISKPDGSAYATSDLLQMVGEHVYERFAPTEGVDAARRIAQDYVEKLKLDGVGTGEAVVIDSILQTELAKKGRDITFKTAGADQLQLALQKGTMLRVAMASSKGAHILGLQGFEGGKVALYDTTADGHQTYFLDVDDFGMLQRLQGRYLEAAPKELAQAEIEGLAKSREALLDSLRKTSEEPGLKPTPRPAGSPTPDRPAFTPTPGLRVTELKTPSAQEQAGREGYSARAHEPPAGDETGNKRLRENRTYIDSRAELEELKGVIAYVSPEGWAESFNAHGDKIAVNATDWSRPYIRSFMEANGGIELHTRGGGALYLFPVTDATSLPEAARLAMDASIKAQAGIDTLRKAAGLDRLRLNVSLDGGRGVVQIETKGERRWLGDVTNVAAANRKVAEGGIVFSKNFAKDLRGSKEGRALLKEHQVQTDVQAAAKGTRREQFVNRIEIRPDPTVKPPVLLERDFVSRKEEYVHGMMVDVAGSTVKMSDTGVGNADRSNRAEQARNIKGLLGRVETVVTEHGGQVIKTRGDASYAVFPTREAQLAAAGQLRGELPYEVGKAGVVKPGSVKISIGEGPATRVVDTKGRVDMLGGTMVDIERRMDTSKARIAMSPELERNLAAAETLAKAEAAATKWEGADKLLSRTPSELKGSAYVVAKPEPGQELSRWNPEKYDELRMAETENRDLVARRQELNGKEMELFGQLRKAGGDAEAVARLQKQMSDLKAEQAEVLMRIPISAKDVARLRAEAGVELRFASAEEAHKGDPAAYKAAADGQLKIKGNILVIGDIHLTGTNGITERRFAGILDYIRANADTIQHVIVMGDVLDARAKFDSHQARFEYSANALKRIGEALGYDYGEAAPGEKPPVSVVTGNHDLIRLGMTPEELAKLPQTRAELEKMGIFGPPDDARNGAKGSDTLYDLAEKRNLHDAWGKYAAILTEHPLERYQGPIAGVEMNVGHDVPLRHGASPNMRSVLRESELAPDEYANPLVLDAKTRIAISADRHTPYAFVGPTFDGKGGFDWDHLLNYASAGTIGQARADYMPPTFMMINPTENGDGRFYQYDATNAGDYHPDAAPDKIKPVLIEQAAYQLPDPIKAGSVKPELKAPDSNPGIDSLVKAGEAAVTPLVKPLEAVRDAVASLITGNTPADVSGRGGDASVKGETPSPEEAARAKRGPLDRMARGAAEASDGTPQERFAFVTLQGREVQDMIRTPTPDEIQQYRRREKLAQMGASSPPSDRMKEVEAYIKQVLEAPPPAKPEAAPAEQRGPPAPELSAALQDAFDLRRQYIRSSNLAEARQIALDALHDPVVGDKILDAVEADVARQRDYFNKQSEAARQAHDNDAAEAWRRKAEALPKTREQIGLNLQIALRHGVIRFLGPEEAAILDTNEPAAYAKLLGGMPSDTVFSAPVWEDLNRRWNAREERPGDHPIGHGVIVINPSESGATPRELAVLITHEAAHQASNSGEGGALSAQNAVYEVHSDALANSAPGTLGRYLTDVYADVRQRGLIETVLDRWGEGLLSTAGDLQLLGARGETPDTAASGPTPLDRARKGPPDEIQPQPQGLLGRLKERAKSAWKGLLGGGEVEKPAPAQGRGEPAPAPAGRPREPERRLTEPLKLSEGTTRIKLGDTALELTRGEKDGTKGVQVTGGGIDKFFPDSEPRVVNIGRDPKNDVVIPDDRVSRVHLELKIGDGPSVIRDLKSSNGTWIAGEPAPAEAPAQGRYQFKEGPFKGREIAVPDAAEIRRYQRLEELDRRDLAPVRELRDFEVKQYMRENGPAVREPLAKAEPPAKPPQVDESLPGAATLADARAGREIALTAKRRPLTVHEGNVAPEYRPNPELYNKLKAERVILENARGRKIGPTPADQRLNYVILADGTMVVASKTFLELGVKHIQLANGRGVFFSGELGRDPGTNRISIDLQSGTFRRYGGEKEWWSYSPDNVELLQRMASRILGEPVDVVDPRTARRYRYEDLGREDGEEAKAQGKANAKPAAAQAGRYRLKDGVFQGREIAVPDAKEIEAYRERAKLLAQGRAPRVDLRAIEVDMYMAEAGGGAPAEEPLKPGMYRIKSGRLAGQEIPVPSARQIAHYREVMRTPGAAIAPEVYDVGEWLRENSDLKLPQPGQVLRKESGPIKLRWDENGSIELRVGAGNGARLDLERSAEGIKITHTDGHLVLPADSGPRTVLVGRDPGARERANDIVLRSDQVSRAHLELKFDGNEVTIIDLGSKNGTELVDSRGVRVEPVEPKAPEQPRRGGYGNRAEEEAGARAAPRNETPSLWERFKRGAAAALGMESEPRPEARGQEPRVASGGREGAPRARLPELPKIPEGLRIIGPMEAAGVHSANIYEATLEGKPVVVKLNGSRNEAGVLAAMHEAVASGRASLAGNVRLAAPLAESAIDQLDLDKLDPEHRIDRDQLAANAEYGRSLIVFETLPQDFRSLNDAFRDLPGARLQTPISDADWRGLLGSLESLSGEGLNFGDRQNLSNIRFRQSDGHTEFALIDTGEGSKSVIRDYRDLKVLESERGPAAQLREKGLLAPASEETRAMLERASAGRPAVQARSVGYGNRAEPEEEPQVKVFGGKEGEPFDIQKIKGRGGELRVSGFERGPDGELRVVAEWPRNPSMVGAAAEGGPFSMAKTSWGQKLGYEARGEDAASFLTLGPFNALAVKQGALLKGAYYDGGLVPNPIVVKALKDGYFLEATEGQYILHDAGHHRPVWAALSYADLVDNLKGRAQVLSDLWNFSQSLNPRDAAQGRFQAQVGEALSAFTLQLDEGTGYMGRAAFRGRSTSEVVVREHLEQLLRQNAKDPKSEYETPAGLQKRFFDLADELNLPRDLKDKLRSQPEASNAPISRQRVRQIGDDLYRKFTGGLEPEQRNAQPISEKKVATEQESTERSEQHATRLRDIDDLLKQGKTAEAREAFYALSEPYLQFLSEADPNLNTDAKRLQAQVAEGAYAIHQGEGALKDLNIQGPRDVYDMVHRAYTEGGDNVAGLLSLDTIKEQGNLSDCTLRATWEHPYLRGLRERMNYDQFVVLAEKITGENVLADGLSEAGHQKLIEALGGKLDWRRDWYSEDGLLKELKKGVPLFGTLRFQMSRVETLTAYRSLDTDFNHSVVVNGAIHQDGRWLYAVTEPHFSTPRLFTFGELRAMGLTFAALDIPTDIADSLDKLEVPGRTVSNLRLAGAQARAAVESLFSPLALLRAKVTDLLGISGRSSATEPRARAPKAGAAEESRPLPEPEPSARNVVSPRAQEPLDPNKPIARALGLNGKSILVGEGNDGSVYKVQTAEGTIALKLPNDSGGVKLLNEARMTREVAAVLSQGARQGLVPAKFGVPTLLDYGQVELAAIHGRSFPEPRAEGWLDRIKNALGFETPRREMTSEALAMSWVDGVTVEKALELKRDGKMTLAEWRTFKDSWENTLKPGVAFLKSQGIALGDLHEENVMVNLQTGEVTAIDAGKTARYGDPAALEKAMEPARRSIEAVEKAIQFHDGPVKPVGDRFEVVRFKDDPVGGGKFLGARLKPASEKTAGIPPPVLHEIAASRLGRQLGFHVEDGLLWYPDAEGLNARLAALRGGNEGYFTFARYDGPTGLGGRVPDHEYFAYIAEGKALISAGGDLHFHDVAVHALGFALLPKEIVAAARAQAALLLKLTPDFILERSRIEFRGGRFRGGVDNALEDIKGQVGPRKQYLADTLEETTAEFGDRALGKRTPSDITSLLYHVANSPGLSGLPDMIRKAGLSDLDEWKAVERAALTPQRYAELEKDIARTIQDGWPDRSNPRASLQAPLEPRRPPKAELRKLLSEQGSTGQVFEGTVDGKDWAIKTRNDGDLGIFRREVQRAREMSDALRGTGMAPAVLGEVDIGGAPAYAMEPLSGKELYDLTAAEAARLTPDDARQAAAAIRRLKEAGLYGGDSPGIMRLDRDQTVNGVSRKAGDLVLMDAGGLVRSTPREIEALWERESRFVQPGWQTPEGIATRIMGAKLRGEILNAPEMKADLERLANALGREPSIDEALFDGEIKRKVALRASYDQFALRARELAREALQQTQGRAGNPGAPEDGAKELGREEAPADAAAFRSPRSPEELKGMLADPDPRLTETLAKRVKALFDSYPQAKWDGFQVTSLIVGGDFSRARELLKLGDEGGLPSYHESYDPVRDAPKPDGSAGAALAKAMGREPARAAIHDLLKDMYQPDRPYVAELKALRRLGRLSEAWELVEGIKKAGPTFSVDRVLDYAIGEMRADARAIQTKGGVFPYPPSAETVAALARQAGLELKPERVGVQTLKDCVAQSFYNLLDYARLTTPYEPFLRLFEKITGVDAALDGLPWEPIAKALGFHSSPLMETLFGPELANAIEAGTGVGKGVLGHISYPDVNGKTGHHMVALTASFPHEDWGRLFHVKDSQFDAPVLRDEGQFKSLDLKTVRLVPSDDVQGAALALQGRLSKPEALAAALKQRLLDLFEKHGIDPSMPVATRPPPKGESSFSPGDAWGPAPGASKPDYARMRLDPKAPLDDKLGLTGEEERIGKGAFGEVYRVHGKDGPLAMKIAEELGPGALRDEARIVREVTDYFPNGLTEHVGAARFVAFGSVMGREGSLVMEEAPGIQVTKLLSGLGQGKVSPEEWRGFKRAWSEFPEALARLHGRDIAHKDIKSSNLLWDSKQGRLTLVDFGLATNHARVIDEEAHQGALARDAKDTERLDGEIKRAEAKAGPAFAVGPSLEAQGRAGNPGAPPERTARPVEKAVLVYNLSGTGADFGTTSRTLDWMHGIVQGRGGEFMHLRGHGAIFTGPPDALAEAAVEAQSRVGELQALNGRPVNLMLALDHGLLTPTIDPTGHLHYIGDAMHTASNALAAVPDGGLVVTARLREALRAPDALAHVAVENVEAPPKAGERSPLAKLIPQARLDVSPAGPRGPPLVTAGEPRSVTVMHLDVEGSSLKVKQLGHEKAFELLTDVSGQAAKIVERHGGKVSKTEGDSLEAEFSAVDPITAMNAALELQAAARDGSLNPGGKPGDVSLKLSVARGEVIPVLSKDGKVIDYFGPAVDTVEGNLSQARGGRIAVDASLAGDPQIQALAKNSQIIRLLHQDTGLAAEGRGSPVDRSVSASPAPQPAEPTSLLERIKNFFGFGSTDPLTRAKELINDTPKLTRMYRSYLEGGLSESDGRVIEAAQTLRPDLFPQTHGFQPPQGESKAQPPLKTIVLDHPKYVANGGYGAVYEERTANGRVAAKVADLGQLADEAKLIPRVDADFHNPSLASRHPAPDNFHVLKLLEHGQTSAAGLTNVQSVSGIKGGMKEVLRLEWAEGEPAHRYLARETKRLAGSPEELKAFREAFSRDWTGFRQGINRLHELGYFHGDLGGFEEKTGQWRTNFHVARDPATGRFSFTLIDYGLMQQTSDVGQQLRLGREENRWLDGFEKAFHIQNNDAPGRR